MIKSFGNRLTKNLYHGIPSKDTRQFPNELHRLAIKKLTLINGAGNLRDIALYPGNRLEKKQGDLKDYYAIWINDQWRITFKWEGADASEVTIIDYH